MVCLAIWIVAVAQEVDYVPAVGNVLQFNQHSVMVVILYGFFVLFLFFCFISLSFGSNKCMCVVSHFSFVISPSPGLTYLFPELL